MMAKETTHICDGCGAKHYGDDFPSMWKRVEVSIDRELDEGMGRLAHGTYDLCGACTDLLIERANPSTWNRPTAQVPL
jgi:hypothetical protein